MPTLPPFANALATDVEFLRNLQIVQIALGFENDACSESELF